MCSNNPQAIPSDLHITQLEDQLLANIDAAKAPSLHQRIKKLADYARGIIDGLLEGQKTEAIVYNAFEMQMLHCTREVEQDGIEKGAQVLEILDEIVGRIDFLETIYLRNRNANLSFNSKGVWS